MVVIWAWSIRRPFPSPYRMLAGENISRLSGFRLVWWAVMVPSERVRVMREIHAAAGLW